MVVSAGVFSQGLLGLGPPPEFRGIDIVIGNEEVICSPKFAVILCEVERGRKGPMFF
jgi:hypothetical protein